MSISTYPQVVGLALPCLLMIWAVPFKNLIKVGIPDLCLFLYLLWNVMRVVVRRETPDPLIIAFDIYLFFIYIIIRFASKRQMDVGLRIVYFWGVLEAFICILQYMEVLPSNHSSFPITGSFHNPGPLAGFLVITFFLGGHLLQQLLKNKRSIYWILLYVAGLALQLFILIISDSRAAWLSLLGGIFLFLYKEKVPDKFKKIKQYIGVVLIFLLAGASVFLYYFKKDSADGRIIIWKATWEMCKESPVTGWGFHSFPQHYMHFQADYLKKTTDTREILLADNTTYAFNEGLRIMAEDGIIGLLLFIGFCGSILYPFFRRNSASNPYALVYCALIGILIFGLFSYPGSIPAIQLAFILLSGILTNLNNRPYILKFNKNRLLKSMICLVSIIGLCIHAYQWFIYNNASKEMRVFIENKEKADRTILQKAQQTFWYNASYMLFYSAIVFNQKEYADALPVVEQAARLQPSSYLFSELGECYYQVGNNEQAEQAFRKAAEMTPGYVTPHYKLFSFYRQSGQLEKAAAIAQYLLDAKYKQYGSIAIFARKEAKDFLEMYKVSVEQHKEGGKMIGN